MSKAIYALSGTLNHAIAFKESFIMDKVKEDHAKCRLSKQNILFFLLFDPYDSNAVFCCFDYQTDIFLRTLDTWRAMGKTDAASIKAVFSGPLSEVWNGIVAVCFIFLSADHISMDPCCLHEWTKWTKEHGRCMTENKKADINFALEKHCHGPNRPRCSVHSCFHQSSSLWKNSR